MKHKNIHSISATVFIVIAIAHLLRIIFNIPAQFGNWQVPMLVSWIAIIITITLANLLIKNSKNLK